LRLPCAASKPITTLRRAVGAGLVRLVFVMIRPTGPAPPTKNYKKTKGSQTNQIRNGKIK